jgi:type IV pilus assembly protein PilY1
MKTLSEQNSLLAVQKCNPIVMGFLAAMMTLPAQAGIVIPDTPLQSGAPVPPNIMFILDNSGSMSYTALYDENVGPITGLGNDLVLADQPNDDFGNTNDMSRQSYTSNTIHYNPAVNYTTWRTAAGGFLPNVTYGAAYTNAELASGGTTNLLSNNQVFHVPKVGITNINDATQYYRYTLKTDGTLLRQERVDAGGMTGWTWGNNTNVASPSWTDPTGNVINRSIAQEQQNYATWYSFHRTRMKVAKAGAGAAFNDLGANIRVGFDTINNSGTNRLKIPVGTDNGLFRDLTTPTATSNRSDWYARLYSIQTTGSTPLRFAMRSAGNYFADSSATGPWGPESGTAQLACRQNFAIMTTDGYWNDSGFTQTDGDSVAGPVHSTPAGLTYQYTPARPFLTANDQGSTLADESMFWWKNDLRTDMDNIVPTSNANPAFWQHMVTFGVPLLAGTLDPTDLPALIAGPTNWTNPFPNFDNTRIDDLFHASVNGHGAFVQANSPDKFRNGLRAALANIVARTGSNSNVSANSAALGTDTRVYQASYISGQWTGELVAYGVNPDRTVATTPSWIASQLIPAPASRNILTWNGSIGAVFPTSAQATTLTADIAAYIRGDRSKEKQVACPTCVLRDRISILGDIVYSSPAYSSEASAIFVSANDGMLHGFDAVTGVERFAYVPGGVNMTDLKTIADPDYAHRFFVDGPVVVSDKKQTRNVSNFTSPNSDKNILIGTLGRGGKGLFALDVTNPSAMTNTNVKWEAAADPLMGYVLGRPFIARANNGMAVAIVPNGVNSTNDRAALFVYNLNTGAVLAKIDTGVGSATTPNGLSSPIGWDRDDDGKLDYVYAGDLQGNMWKFDLTSATPSTWQAAASRKVLYAADDAGSPAKKQPITGTPTVAVDPSTGKRWVFFGTGKYMEINDAGNAGIQTWYGIYDEDVAISGRSALQQRTIAQVGLVNGQEARAFEQNTALGTGKKGWYINLVNPSPGVAEGERMIGAQEIFNSELRANSYVPNATACGVGGKGYVNRIDPFTGTTTTSASFDVDGNGSFSNDTIGSGTLTTFIGSVGNSSGGINDGINISSSSGSNYNTTTTGGVNVSFRGRAPENLGRISWRELLRD